MTSYTIQNGKTKSGRTGIVLTGENGIRHEFEIDTIIDGGTDSEQIVQRLCDEEAWNMPDTIEHDGQFIFIHYGPAQLG